MPPSLRPDRRTDPYRRLAAAAAREQGDVLSLAQVREAGIPWWFVRAEVRIGRWTRPGRRTVVLHNGPLTPLGQRWLAVLEAGPRAALDGVSVLQHLGVRVDDDGAVHVIAPRGAGAPARGGVMVHESRRFREEDVTPVGLRATRPEVAAVHAALWARTDREAALMLVLVVQQRLCTPAALSAASGLVKRHRRRKVIHRVVADLLVGVRSLGELDVARAMRRRGLPEPDRQSIRRRPSGTEYLDADFEAFDITLEVDGAQHDLPLQRLLDLLRDLALATEGRTVLRLPLMVWNLDEDAVLDALEALFASRGWRRPAA